MNKSIEKFQNSYKKAYSPNNRYQFNSHTPKYKTKIKFPTENKRPQIRLKKLFQKRGVEEGKNDQKIL